MSQSELQSIGYTKAAWVLCALALLLILVFHLLPALFSGMMVYELVHLMKPAIKRRTTDRRKTLIAVAFLAGFVGPILLTPGSPQGPLLGIFITGPLGALAGAVLGLIIG